MFLLTAAINFASKQKKHYQEEISFQVCTVAGRHFRYFSFFNQLSVWICVIQCTADQFVDFKKLPKFVLETKQSVN